MAKEKTEKALFSFLRPEFINRIDEIITFNHLTKHNFEQIAKIMLSKLTAALDDKGMHLTYSDALVSLIAEKSFSEKFGARNMRRFIERNCEDLIANTIVEKYPEKIIGIYLDVDDDKVTIKTI